MIALESDIPICVSFRCVSQRYQSLRDSTLRLRVLNSNGLVKQLLTVTIGSSFYKSLLQILKLGFDVM